MKLFCLAFLQLFLLTVQSRLANRCQYGGMIVVNIAVGFCYFTIFHELMKAMESSSGVYFYIAGTTLGSLLGAYIHNKWSKKEM